MSRWFKTLWMLAVFWAVDGVGVPPARCSHLKLISPGLANLKIHNTYMIFGTLTYSSNSRAVKLSRRAGSFPAGRVSSCIVIGGFLVTFLQLVHVNVVPIDKSNPGNPAAAASSRTGISA